MNKLDKDGRKTVLQMKVLILKDRYFQSETMHLALRCLIYGVTEHLSCLHDNVTLQPFPSTLNEHMKMREAARGR